MRSTGLVLLVFCVAVMCACNAGKEAAIVQVPVNEVPSIIFIQYKLYRTNGSMVSAKFLKPTIVKGKLKPTTELKRDNASFKVHFSDMEGKLLTSFLLADPLNMEVEYLSDEGNYGRRLIAADSASLFLRAELPVKTSTIELYQFISDSFALIDKSPFKSINN